MSALSPRFESHVFPAKVRERFLRGAGAWVDGNRAVVTAASGFPRHWPSLLDAARIGVEQPVVAARAMQSRDPSFELGARAKSAAAEVQRAQQQFLDYLTPDIHLVIAMVGPRSLQFVMAGAAYVARVREGRAEVLSQFQAEGLVEGRTTYDETGVKPGDVAVVASASCFGPRPHDTLAQLGPAHDRGRLGALLREASKGVERAGAAVVISF